MPIKLPLLRVFPNPDGSIVPFNPNKHSTDDWWGAVLEDPRARTRFKNDWEDLLGRHRGEMFRAKCDKCIFEMHASVDDLISRYGLNCTCIHAAGALYDELGRSCRFRKACKLTYETTVPFKPPAR